MDSSASPVHPRQPRFSLNRRPRPGRLNVSMKNIVRWLSAILLLPVNVTVIAPLLLFEFDSSQSSNLEKGLSLFVGVIGVSLSISSVRLFAIKGGGGTPAPWDPINRLIIAGPYRHVRNPMLIGVIAVLFCEALFFYSLPMLVYACVFVLANVIYFPCSEEPALVKRHGDEYQRYLNNVPRWIPRTKPYYLERSRESRNAKQSRNAAYLPR